MCIFEMRTERLRGDPWPKFTQVLQNADRDGILEVESRQILIPNTLGNGSGSKVSGDCVQQPWLGIIALGVSRAWNAWRQWRSGVEQCL